MKPYTLIVCWKCKKSRVTLRKCKNGTDYVCEACFDFEGNKGPAIGNQSKIYFKDKE